MKQNSTIGDMKTLATCINKLVEDGYKADFKVVENGILSLTDERLYKSEEVSIVNFYRFEGASDPADNSILYVIEANDGVKGTLTDAYGAYSDELVNKFIKEVEEISKKPVHS